MLQGISLWTRSALVDGGEINSLLTGTLLCCRDRIGPGDVRLKAVDEGKVCCGILKDGDSACFNEVSYAFCLAMLTCEAPFISVARLFCISVRDKRHIHDLANLQESWVELSSDEFPASSTQRLVVQRYSNFRCCCRCCDTEHGKSGQKHGQQAELRFHFSGDKDH